MTEIDQQLHLANPWGDVTVQITGFEQATMTSGDILRWRAPAGTLWHIRLHLNAKEILTHATHK